MNKSLVAFIATGTPEGNSGIFVSVKPLGKPTQIVADTGLRMSGRAAMDFCDDHCDSASIVSDDSVDSAVAALLTVAA